ncbi:MAG TPA: hypothetical protein PKD59_08485 [Miltoncostaeaceae bacterium]|nr:hypothetical protein [Miltoncostaeaceae bacterium]
MNESTPDEDAYDDMRLAGWEDFLAARERFIASLGGSGGEDADGEEVSRRRRPASGWTCP